MARLAGRSLKIVLTAGLVALGLSVFAPVARFGFVNFDDPLYVTANESVRSGLTWRNALWALTSLDAGMWHPLTWLSLQADAQLFGDRAGGFHLVNLFWHLAGTIALFAVLDRATSQPWPSAVVAALFAVHPLHVESVAWIAERKDVLSTAFALAALYAYTGYAQHGGRGRYVAMTGLWLLSLSAKPAWVTFPLLLLLWDIWPLRRWPPRTATVSDPRRTGDPATTDRSVSTRPFLSLCLEKLPLLPIALAVGITTIVAEARFDALRSTAEFPLGGRLAQAAVSYWEYVAKMIWPTQLCVFYPYPSAPPAWWLSLAAAASLFAATLTAVAMVRRQPLVAVGWLWYVVALMPMSGLIQVGRFRIADRFSYVPLIGLFILVAWLFEFAGTGSQRRRFLSRLGTVAVVVALGFVARDQVLTWSDSETLFRHALNVTEENALAHHNLGAALANRGQFDEAAAHFRRAVAIRPDYRLARRHLALALGDLGRIDEALREAERLLADDPDDPHAASLVRTLRADRPARPAKPASRGPSGRG